MENSLLFHFERNIAGSLKNILPLKIKSVVLVMAFFTLNLFYSQTTLISPTVNNGGFETNGAGWLTAQNQPNRADWIRGIDTSYSGTKSAYISNNGSSNLYTGDRGTYSHLYRAVTFPAGETVINLSFYWKGNGEGGGDYDNLKVYVSNMAPTAGVANANTARVGANYYNVQTTWQKAEITLPANFAGTTKYLIFQWKQDNTVTNNPPAAIDNITLTTQAPAVACTGTPAPGDTVASINPVPEGGGATVLSLQNATAGSGVLYQWKSSADGVTYTNIAGATASTYTASVTSSIFYRCVVTCGGTTGASTPIQVKVSYCTSVPRNDGYNDGITRVNFNTINNITSSNAGTEYTDYSNISTNVVKGTSYNLNVNINTAGNATYYQTAFIDWNRNGVFTDSDETYRLGSVTNTTNGLTSMSPFSITVPAGAVLGPVSMRIQSRFSGYGSPCGTGFSGEVEDYTLNVIESASCTGTPTGGTTTLSPTTGAPSSAFTATVTGDSFSGGLSYQWQISDSNAGPWSDIANQTNASANLTAVPLPGATNFYRRKITCNSSGLFTYSSVKTFATGSVTYCGTGVPPANHNFLYIDSFKFVGTLNDNPTAFTSAGSGYSDFTNLTPVVKQQQGSVLNIVASAKGVVNGNIQARSGRWKAWVDFNGDGIYGATELVYSLTKFGTESLTFGFVIPSTTPIGKYRLRIKVGNTLTFDSCTGSTSGETEDYLFEVIADCSAKVNTASLSDGSRCGTGPVLLSATGTDSVSGLATGIRWYATASGGVPLFEGENYTTDDIPENTSKTFYVVAYNETCESVFRIPVNAIADPGPSVAFGAVPAFCAATTTGQVITASSGKRIDILVEEKFDTGLGAFKQSPTETGFQDYPDTYWIKRSSPYRPRSTTDTPAGPYEGLSPALSSGYFGGNFAMTNADYDRYGSLLNRLTLSDNLITTNFENLTLEFDLYYFTLITAQLPPDPSNPPNLPNYFSIDYSVDGSTWVNLKTISTNQGTPIKWEKISLSTLNTVASGNNLPATLLNTTTLKFRLSSFSFAKTDTKSFKESIAAVDNLKVFGLKDESSLFGWTSTASGILFQENCSTPLGTAKSAKICIKPTDAQIENNTQFSITAQAIFTNGCPAIGTTIINNDAKIYKTTASTDWNTSGNWLPNDNLVPDITKCVIIKNPVILNLGSDGLARNVSVESGGSLQIMAPRTLTINEYLKNNAGQDKVLLESDANLIQQKSSSVNVGPLTAKRALTGLRNGPTYIDYVYWSSPVAGQLTKGSAPGAFSPGTPPSSFFSYRESNDQFYETSDLEFIPGKGYAVEAEVGISAKTYTFKGVPNNGNKSINIKRSANTLEGSPPVTYIHGYNLVGNPYPSNISFDKLYDGNSALIYKTAWFWTNNKIYTPQQMGSQYEGNNYAIYNATGGNSAAYTVSTGSTYSEGFIKVGQAFIVQNKQQENSNSDLIFTNDMRVSDPGQFFSKGTSEKNRFWVTLTNPANVVNSQLIGYMDGASDGFEQDFDAESFGDYSDLFYSKLDDMKLVIQGRNQNFKTSDKVNLGAVISQNGVYTISLNKAEGIFGKTQKIYLKDKIAGIVTDLKTNDYSFTTTKGISEGRFEIIYNIDAVLAIDEVHKENIVVYREANTFGIKATQKILEVEMFDYAGRLIAKLQPLLTSSKIPADSLPNGIYLLQIKLANGDTITKKIRK